MKEIKKDTNVALENSAPPQEISLKGEEACFQSTFNACISPLLF